MNLDGEPKLSVLVSLKFTLCCIVIHWLLLSNQILHLVFALLSVFLECCKCLQCWLCAET